GLWKFHNDKGKLRQTILHRKGNPKNLDCTQCIFDGVKKTFNEDGVMVAEITYGEGKLRQENFFYMNGNRKKSIYYPADKKKDRCGFELFADDGSLQVLADRSPEDYGFTGSIKRYYPGGKKVQAEETFKNNTRVTLKRFDQDG